MKKTAIVTGASRGIGYAAARQLALDGFQIAAAAVSPYEKNEAAIRELREYGEIHYIQADIARADGREKIVEETLRHFGRVDVLVNNAGVAPLERADLLDMTEESFDRVVGTNTKGTLFLCQLAANQMLRQEPVGSKRGTIINISSCSADVVSLNRGEYCVSKAGLSMVTQLFAKRLAVSGIYVHEIRPGVIATDMTARVQEKYEKLIADGAFPIARWGTPEDVAGAVSAFAGDLFLYSTGDVINVDGGFHIREL